MPAAQPTSPLLSDGSWDITKGPQWTEKLVTYTKWQNEA